MLQRSPLSPKNRPLPRAAISKSLKPCIELLESRFVLNGTNLITNGDFEAGNTGFSTAYTLSPGDIGPAASYDIVDNPAHSRPHDVNPVSYGDHTTGSGLMMAVNGSSNPQAIVWSETISVTPSTQYGFSLWLSSWFAGSPATLDFQFNGVSIGTPAAPSTTGIWQSFAAAWNSGTSSSLTINIVDTNPADGGSDFAIDDIFLSRQPILNPANGHFYELVTTASPISWDQANADASALTFEGAQGNLATVTSASEQAFVSSTFDFASVPGQGTYIGGFQPAGSTEPAGGWQWVTGEPGPVTPNYTNWGAGEPNNQGGDEDVIEYPQNNSDLWNDIARNNLRQAYLVEFDPSPGQIQIQTSAYSVNENAGSLSVVISRTDGTGGTVTVGYQTSDGTAKAGQRYTATSGTLTFAPGVSQQQISIPVTNDNLVWPDIQNFKITISNPTNGATLGAQTVANIVVQEDDLPQVANATPKLATLQAAAVFIAKSTEHYQEFVTSAYTRFLGRQPDSPGLSYWVGQMRLYETSNHLLGIRQEDIEASFLDSPEYLSRFGGVGAAWIKGIYNDLLGRQADSNGLQFWLAKLNAGVPPELIAESFTSSTERLTNAITNSYETLLGRTPDALGLAHWLSVFVAGGTVEDINAGFVGSLEYYRQQIGAAGNAARWVRQAYLDLLFRPPAVGDENSWLTFLSN